VVHPLLVLAANQVQRLSSANKAFAPVGALYLDEEVGSSKVFLDCLVQYLRGIGHRIARTVFLVSLPQLLASQTHVSRSGHLSICSPYQHSIYECWDGIIVIKENEV
jgi:hypothetical protein